MAFDEPFCINFKMKRINTKAIITAFFFIICYFLFNPEANAKKLYSYQSGNWHNATNVWTTDSTGTTLVGSSIPITGDFVCILTGRTITASLNITTTGHVIFITIGATLDLVDKTLTSIVLNGNGLLRTRRSGVSPVLPVITAGNFMTLDGGTVEYYALTGNIPLDASSIATYCNLIINLDTVTQFATVTRNLTIFGSLTVKGGTFQINDATTVKRTIIINGDFTVETNAKVTTGTGNTNTLNYRIQGTIFLPPVGFFHKIFHELSIGGNFTNNGIVRFTNLLRPNYGEFANNGAVTVRYTGERNSALTLNGRTDFYNLIVDKGTDQTYILTINSTDSSNFALYGSNAVRRNDSVPYSQDNPEVRKALWIKNGTLKLTGKIFIPTLAEGPRGNSGNGDYAIGSTSQLWIAGPDVWVYVTATDTIGYHQAPGGALYVSPPSTAEQALSIFGTFRISDGYFSTRHSAGIIFWNTANSASVVMIEGGIVNATVMRSTWTAPGKTSYVQTGGTVYVRGNEGEDGEMSTVPIFNIPNPSSTFVMTGGNIIIRDRNNGLLPNGNGLYLNCDPGNFSVTGGTVTFEINPGNTDSINIYSKVNFWNLNIKRLGTTGNAKVRLLYNLVVSNKLEIDSNATLYSGFLNNNIYSYGDFNILIKGTYVPGTNTTSFPGYGNYFLWNDGSITNGLYNLEVNKTEGSLILVSSGNSFIVRNDLRIMTGTLADGGKAVYVSGNVINNGSHLGAGKISMVKTTGTQTISGNGLGLFQNLELNNSFGSMGSSPVSMAADFSIIGRLTLANDRLFNLDKYQLSLMTLATVEGPMSNNRFLLTTGNPSDGGIRRQYSDTISFIFPVGSPGNYTPAIIHIKKNPGTYGFVTVKPVPLKHPFTTNTSCLPAYWKIEESGFSDIQPGSISLEFFYGNLPDNVLYVPGKYIPATWIYTADVSLVNEATNLINFPSEDSFTGDYTAGIPESFGLVTSFYSRKSGDWHSASTWSNVGYGGVAALTTPGASNPVFIGDSIANNDTVKVTAGNAMSGSLSILKGSVLDLGTTAGNNFGTVIPGSNGKMRITSNLPTALFPAGDFGNFLGQNGGIVEYYSGGLGFLLPLISSVPTSRAIKTYHDLSLNPATGFPITMPNTDLTVFGYLMVNGSSGTALAKFNAAATRTLTVRDSIRINSGNLQFQNTVGQALRVDGDIVILSGALFTVASTGTAANNTLSIGGNIRNDGILDMSISSSLKCEITFTGNTETVIEGRGSVNDYYLITVDKGTSAIPVLNVLSMEFSFSNNDAPLILVNGTFRLTSLDTVAVSVSGFDIPSTTCLSANGGTILVGTSASDNADVFLSGMIEVKLGAIKVGTSSNNNNNDIEYSGAGYPAIEVRGGALFVNGQVRRSMINGLGSLVYIQSGTSTVTINGRNGQPTRAKLEVVNSGSVFNMSNGTLTIVRGGSTTYNDLYIRPESSVVLGGTIVFGNADTEATTVSNLTLDSTFPLNNITVDGTTNPKTLTLAVNPLILKGNLLINSTSAFKADSLNVSIAGNLTNLNTSAVTGVNAGGFRPGSFRQLTTLNGSLGNQVIGGVAGNLTNFAMLVVNNTFTGGIINLQTDTTALRINGDLTLTRGILADGGNIITVIGDIYNAATHSSTGSGRINLAGPAVQVLNGDGNGKFGNLYLNNTYDVRMIADMEITGVLTIRNKLLDIGHKLLVLSNTASNAVTASTSFASTRCIRTDGLVSDAGVRKRFPSGPSSFTFPLGVPGKYVRVILDVTANGTPGTITVIPVNTAHPCLTGTSVDYLRFYWHLYYSGFSGVTINHQYYYLGGDVNGSEANWDNGDRYFNGVWDNPPSGTLDKSNNIIYFTGKNFIAGDYTAGDVSVFGIVPTYYSRNITCTAPLVGNWGSGTTWSTTSHAGAAAAQCPTGEPVVIATNHIVSTNDTSRKTSIMTLNGTGLIDLASSVGHDFGTVLGTGTIRLTPSAAGFYVFPAGNFTTFTNTGGGTIILSNPPGSAVFPYLTTYNNLILNGAGTKQMIDADITINGLLTNEAASTFISSSVAKLILKADWLNDGGFLHNSGSTIFDGSTTLSGINPPVLNNLAINSGKYLTGPSSADFGVAGNWVNNGLFNHNSCTVNFTGSTTISGLSVTTFNNIAIENGKTLTGKLDDGIIMEGNWINDGSFNHNGGNVIFDGISVVSGNSETSFGNLTINDSKVLTGPLSAHMNVALDFTNFGTFHNNAGTLVFNGSVQNLGGSSSTLFENITIDAGSNTTISAPGQSIRGVLLSNGVLNANESLTLLSDAERTALIDGSGAGEVAGILTMQRYLPSGFGYKYFSSPFQAADVGQFGDHMSLSDTIFPTFYRYDENRIFTGWLKYIDPSGILYPMQGYAVNFGPASAPITVDFAGEVNNNTMLPVTMFNGDHPFTQGFNLVGNPYPSPINWDSPVGWVRNNVDSALYFFNAGTTDQYTGTYSTYIKGISSDSLTTGPIIPAMQGFFIHVSDGSFPVSATLIFTNEVRVNNLSPHFHKAMTADTRPIFRMAARFATRESHGDPLVIYFDDDASMRFDSDCDALKLMNTDISEPNFYILSEDSKKLSISGIPFFSDSLIQIPLGVKTKQDGVVIFNCRDIGHMPLNMFVYFCDNETGVSQNLVLHPEYKAFLNLGQYDNRFSLVFSKKDLRSQPTPDKHFYVYSYRNRLYVYMNLPPGLQADLSVFSMLGQRILHDPLEGNGYREMDLTIPTGVYIVKISSGTEVYTRKIYINNQW
jgi:hypothetical protein